MAPTMASPRETAGLKRPPEIRKKTQALVAARTSKGGEEDVSSVDMFRHPYEAPLTERKAERESNELDLRSVDVAGDGHWVKHAQQERIERRSSSGPDVLRIGRTSGR